MPLCICYCSYTIKTTQTGEDAEKRCGETDQTVLMEGLYIKIERDGEVMDRMKFVRPSFLQCVELSNSHWLSRPIVPNRLAYPLENIFMPELPKEAEIL
jgi:hypothetical protein